MRKKYLNTIEDIEALRNTDTKIYVENHGGYYKFINGVLCSFHCDGKDFNFQTHLWLSQEPYIEVEELVKEADENDIGKLCEFWDGDHKGHAISTLERLQPGNFAYKATYGAGWEHCRRLTPAEVAEITGYKVVKEA